MASPVGGGSDLLLSPLWGFGCLTIRFQGLTPLAIDFRPVGAATYYANL